MGLQSGAKYVNQQIDYLIAFVWKRNPRVDDAVPAVVTHIACLEKAGAYLLTVA